MTLRFLAENSKAMSIIRGVETIHFPLPVAPSARMPRPGAWRLESRREFPACPAPPVAPVSGRSGGWPPGRGAAGGCGRKTGFHGWRSKTGEQDGSNAGGGNFRAAGAGTQCTRNTVPARLGIVTVMRLPSTSAVTPSGRSSAPKKSVMSFVVCSKTV